MASSRLTLATTAAWLLLNAAAFGQAAQSGDATDVPPGVPVGERPRPHYDPPGLRVGGFLVFPDLDLQEKYDSNIFATQRGERADLISTIAPSIDARSDWANHGIDLHADALVAKYADNDREDYIDRTLAAAGHLDIQHDARVFGEANYRVRHEPRSSPDNPAASVEPIEYTVYGARVGGEKEFNRLAFRLESLAERYRFDDGVTPAGLPVDQGGRNRDQIDVRLRSAYELMPLRQVYLLTAYNRRDYDRTIDAGGFERDSSGVTVGPGVKYDLDGVVLFDLFVGFRRQDFADRRLPTVNTAVSEAKLIWNVTKLTTLTGQFGRDLSETTIPGASSYIISRAGLTADHELLRDVLINAGLGYERDSFEGIQRTDNYYVAGLAAKYLIDRHLWASAGYDFRERASNAAGTDFTEHAVSLRLSTHF